MSRAYVPRGMCAFEWCSAIEGALAHLGMGTLDGKEVVVQGVGTVGLALIRQLLARRVGRLVAADTNRDALDHAARLLEDQPLELRLAGPDDMSILAERCDVLAPTGPLACVGCGMARGSDADALSSFRLRCRGPRTTAVGAVLNPITIPTVKAKVRACAVSLAR